MAKEKKKIREKDGVVVEVKTAKEKLLGVRDSEDLPLVETFELLQDVKEMILQGFSRSEVLSELNEQFPDVEYSKLNYLYNRGLTFYKHNALEREDLLDLIHLHIFEYEQIYKYFCEVDFLPGKKKALRMKETLLGVHKTEQVIEVNQNNTTIVDTQNEYDFEKLDKDEKVKLNEFLKRISR